MQYFSVRFITVLVLIFPIVMVSGTICAAEPLAGQRVGIWLSKKEIMHLPVSGLAWEHVLKHAERNTSSPNLSDMNDPVNVRVLAKALVYARTGEERYRVEVINACMAAINTENGGRTLSLARELLAYVIAADMVGLPTELDTMFRRWLRETLSKNLSGRTLRSTHEDRPNNWGTHAGASRIAVALYLEDYVELENAARVFKGFLGDRSAYASFKYGNRSWQANWFSPVGINPAGAKKRGQSIDGVIPDDQRRGGTFSWPPPKEHYSYEALQGALAQAVMLDRIGHDVWNWEDKALLRAFRWLYEVADFPAEGDDTWQPHVINFYYNTQFPTQTPSRPGKNVGFTDWTHAGHNHRAGSTPNLTSDSEKH